MIWITLAWRNFLRNTRKSYFTLLIILVGALAAVVAVGYMKATFMLVKEGTIRGGVGHLQIAENAAFDGYEAFPLQNGLDVESHKKISDMLKQHEQVELVLPRLKFQGLISRGDISMVFMGEGILPKQERRLAQGFINTVQGRGLEYADADDIYQVVIGSELARFLGVNIGDTVTLMAVTGYGGINAVDASVFGISSSGNPELDRLQLYTPLELAQSLILTDKVSRLVVKLHDTDEVGSLQTELQRQLPDFGVRNWRELSPFYEQMVSLYARQFSVFGVIMGLVIILTMLNSILMSLYERKGELATLASMGTPAAAIKTSYVFEGMFVGTVACMLGIFIGFGLTELINASGIEMPPPPGRTEGYRLLILFDSFAALVILAATLLLCALSSWLASHRIGKMKIVEAING